MSSHKKDKAGEATPTELDMKVMVLNGYLSNMMVDRLEDFATSLESNLGKFMAAFQRLNDRITLQMNRATNMQRQVLEMRQTIKELERKYDERDKQAHILNRNIQDLNTKQANQDAAHAKKLGEANNRIQSIQDEFSRTKKKLQMAEGDLKKKIDSLQDTKQALNAKGGASKNLVYKNEIKLYKMLSGKVKIEDQRLDMIREAQQPFLNRLKDQENEDKMALVAYQTLMDQIVRRLAEIDHPSLPLLRWYEPDHMKFPLPLLHDHFDRFIQNFREFCDAVVELAKKPKPEIVAQPLAKTGSTGESIGGKAFVMLTALQSDLLSKSILNDERSGILKRLQEQASNQNEQEVKRSIEEAKQALDQMVEKVTEDRKARQDQMIQHLQEQRLACAESQVQARRFDWLINDENDPNVVNMQRPNVVHADKMETE